MEISMTANKAMTVFGRNGFLGYMGPNYGLKNCVDNFMQKYPRGKGIKAHEKDLFELYEACRFYKVGQSKTKNWKEHV